MDDKDNVQAVSPSIRCFMVFLCVKRGYSVSDPWPKVQRVFVTITMVEELDPYSVALDRLRYFGSKERSLCF